MFLFLPECLFPFVCHVCLVSKFVSITKVKSLHIWNFKLSKTVRDWLINIFWQFMQVLWIFWICNCTIHRVHYLRYLQWNHMQCCSVYYLHCSVKTKIYTKHQCGAVFLEVQRWHFLLDNFIFFFKFVYIDNLLLLHSLTWYGLVLQ